MIPKQLRDKPTCLAVPSELLFGLRAPNASELTEIRAKVQCLDRLQQRLRSASERESELQACTVFCTEDEYSASVSVPVWPSTAYVGSPYTETLNILLEQINDTWRRAEAKGQPTDVLREAYKAAAAFQSSSVARIGQSFQIIRVFASSTRATIKAEELAFPILRFFSNIGGLMGESLSARAASGLLGYCGVSQGQLKYTNFARDK